MSTLAFTLRDSTTMLRRNVRHSLRYPAMTISGLMVPIFFLLLFVGVFGTTLRAGLTGAYVAGGHYIDYLAPGLILMTAGAGAAATAVGICTDMNEGIIARFRTMAITRASVLTGQVIGSFIRTMISGVLVVGVALALGFRPTATPVEWVAAAGMFAGITLALTWLAVAFGLVAKTPEGANSLSLIMIVLPFVSSAFVPTGSMPAGVRWFAQNQPFTPVINTLRGLLTGTPIGHSVVLAVAWCAGIAAIGYVWARRRYNHTAAR
ncbi:MAG: type transport system permease protein [Actinomycetota bacterium]|nr:type transport system permease protein [Actinomycetota bacterium]